MDYSKYSDEELIVLYHDGDKQTRDYLINKYEYMVKKIAKSYYLDGGDMDDLYQEGRIGLCEAIDDYKSGYDCMFITFAHQCIKRKMLSAIEKAGRRKHSPLNSYLSIYEDDFQKEGGGNPEEMLLDTERVRQLETEFDRALSDFERQVLELKLDGLDYQEIAAILDKDPKSTDNAIQRVRNKIKKILK